MTRPDPRWVCRQGLKGPARPAYENAPKRFLASKRGPFVLEMEQARPGLLARLMRKPQ